MEKSKYKFNHFILIDGERKQIDPSKVEVISEQCKLLWANLATGKEHILINKVAQ
ncbi:hypothetical protein MKY29_02835 [Psychrobacillus sp. FSL K6-2365]|uniref:hypothetical protein n=1 Tax=Psychrobacillus sp. FSL K6-2365 TaxID=2921546 RepID=UPI0030F88D80